MEKQFKHDVKVAITRRNGQPGWKKCLKGTTPEDNGLTPEQVKANKHLLVDAPAAKTLAPYTKKTNKKEDK